MINKWIRILNETPAVSDWKIREFKTETCELFYVRKQLETNRATNTSSFSVTIYCDVDGKRGASEFAAYTYMTDEDFRKKLEDNILAASYALNPWYAIPEGQELAAVSSASNLAERPFLEIAEDMVDAVFSVDNRQGGYLSATEFFLTKTDERIVNSRGIDMTSTTYNGEIELIPSWEGEDEDIELYNMLRIQSIDPAEISKHTAELLDLAEARAEAVSLTELLSASDTGNGDSKGIPSDIKVIIQDEEVGEIMSSFASELSYEAKYQKSNKYEVSDQVQGTEIDGDRISMKLAMSCPGAFASRAFDADGLTTEEVSLIEDGIAVANHGSNQYGYYLGVENPTGRLPICVVAPGNTSYDEMTAEPHVRCVIFSGIQVDTNSGYFGGEVRLGFYFDGQREIPVTGFSVSGDLEKSKGQLRLSSETYTGECYSGPKYLEVRGMALV